jgi:hypothetical protein
MKHFIGGSALGFFISLCLLPVGKDKPTQAIVLAFLLGLAAWGLMP